MSDDRELGDLMNTDHRDPVLALERLESAISGLLKLTPEPVRNQMNALALIRLDYAVEGARKALGKM